MRAGDRCGIDGGVRAVDGALGAIRRMGVGTTVLPTRAPASVTTGLSAG